MINQTWIAKLFLRSLDKKPGMATILDSNMAAILDYNI